MAKIKSEKIQPKRTLTIHHKIEIFPTKKHTDLSLKLAVWCRDTNICNKNLDVCKNKTVIEDDYPWFMDVDFKIRFELIYGSYQHHSIKTDVLTLGNGSKRPFNNTVFDEKHVFDM